MKLEIYPNARALIFDLDGTLSDSLPVHIASWHSVCEKLNCSFDERIVIDQWPLEQVPAGQVPRFRCGN